MVSAWNLIVPLAVSLASCAALAQETKIAPTSNPPAASPALSDIATPPLTPERRGDILMARKMYREAIEVYSEAPQDSAVVWNKVGIAYHQMMQLEAAMKRYQHSIRINPKYPEAINNL